MELHLLNLYKLCRICGGNVVTKCGYVNEKTCSDCVDLLRTCFHSNILGIPSKLWGTFEGIWKVSFVLRWGEKLYGGTYKNRLQMGEDLSLKY